MKKCILFAVGSFFDNNPSLYPKNYDVIGYGYSDPLLATSHSNNLKNNKPIYSIEEIVDLQEKEELFVFICSGPWSSYDIYLNLIEKNIKFHLVLFVDETKAFNISWHSRVDETGNVISNINGHDVISVLNTTYGGRKTNLGQLSRNQTTFEDFLSHYLIVNSPQVLDFYNENTQLILKDIRNNKKNSVSSKIRIAICSSGGLGDDLVMCRFIYALHSKIENIIVHFYNKRSENYSYLPYIDKSIQLTEFNYIASANYDLVLEGTRALTIYKYDPKKIKKFSPLLFDYCMYCKKIEDYFYFSSNSEKQMNIRTFIEYTVMLNKKFNDAPDLGEIIANLSAIDFVIPIQQNENEVLKKFGLRNQQYILFNRGCDERHPNHTKLWKLSRYDELVELISQKYHDLKTVQVGNDDYYGCMKSVDLNLLGKTNFEELKILLKNALLLVSGEGGLVHLNHCLKGKSAVLFGPNDVSYVGYDENINIQSKGCPFKCFEVGNLVWAKFCILGHTPPKCMDSITSQDVFASIDKYLKANLND